MTRLFLAAAVVFLAACHPRADADADAGADADAVADAGAGADAGAVAVADAGRRAIPEADARPTFAPPAEPVVDDTPKQLGTIKDWLAHYQGSSEAETFAPPRLGLVEDLKELPETTIVFVRSMQLVRVDLPSKREIVLTHGASANHNPRWTRDARFLFFVSNREGAVDKIFRMRPDGTDVQAITKGIESKKRRVAWAVSDDGARVAYLPGVDGDASELHLVDVASKTDEVIYRDTAIEYPSFSRDDKTLFVTQGLDEPPGFGSEHPKFIRAIDLATHVNVKLPNAGVAEITQPWDLGDGRLLFVASTVHWMGDRAPRMHTMPLLGGAWSDVNPLEAPMGYLDFEVAPDHKQLAVDVTVRRGGVGSDWFADVDVLPLGPGAPKRMTPKFPRPFYSTTSPTWAVDSRHLAFVLYLCPYIGCATSMSTIVIADTSRDPPPLAFVGFGHSPAIAPKKP